MATRRSMLAPTKAPGSCPRDLTQAQFEAALARGGFQLWRHNGRGYPEYRYIRPDDTPHVLRPSEGIRRCGRRVVLAWLLDHQANDRAMYARQLRASAEREAQLSAAAEATARRDFAARRAAEAGASILNSLPRSSGGRWVVAASPGWLYWEPPVTPEPEMPQAPGPKRVLRPGPSTGPGT